MTSTAHTPTPELASIDIREYLALTARVAELEAALRKAERVIEGHLNGSRDPIVGDLMAIRAALAKS